MIEGTLEAYEALKQAEAILGTKLNRKQKRIVLRSNHAKGYIKTDRTIKEGRKKLKSR